MQIELGALELIATILLQSVTHYGWHTALNNNLFTSTSSWSGKLSLVSKALCAYKPDISGIEGVLMEDELCVIVKHLRDISESSFKPKDDSYYSAREILLITKGVTRIPANCTGLAEKGIKEVLLCLMDKNDEKIKEIVGSISWQIATSESTGVDSAITTVGKSQRLVHCSKS